MRGEFDLIARYFAPLAAAEPGAEGLTNDAAVFEPAAGYAVVATVDAMVEGVHFLPDDPPELIGRKLLRVNLSDLAAMGARPRGYLLAAVLSRAVGEPWLARFVAGLAEDQAAFGVTLLGGDTVSTPGPLTLSLTALGEARPGRTLPRSGARAGDHVYVSGTLGDGALGLKALRGELGALAEADRAALAARYRLPEPRVALGPALAEAGIARAAIDVSDGLIADLGHVAETSGLGAEVEAAAVPLSAPARRALEADPALRAAVLGGGDDYEILFAAGPDKAAAIARLAARTGLALTRIGRMTAGPGVRVLDADGREVPVPEGGWTHF